MLIKEIWEGGGGEGNCYPICAELLLYWFTLQSSFQKRDIDRTEFSSIWNHAIYNLRNNHNFKRH